MSEYSEPFPLKILRQRHIIVAIYLTVRLAAMTSVGFERRHWAIVREHRKKHYRLTVNSVESNSRA